MKELRQADFFFGIMILSFVLCFAVFLGKIAGNSPDLKASTLKEQAFQAKCDSITYETKVRLRGFYKNAIEAEVVEKVGETSFGVRLTYPHGVFLRQVECKDLEIL